jgi:hypothetical protein
MERDAIFGDSAGYPTLKISGLFSCGYRMLVAPTATQETSYMQTQENKIVTLFSELIASPATGLGIPLSNLLE